MAGIADWNIGKSTVFPVNEDNDVFEYANLTFGHGTNVPSPGSNVTRGHIYTFTGIDVGPPPVSLGQRLQITRNNTVTRGHVRGAVRAGFIKEDVEPPFDASPDASKTFLSALFACAQEVNGTSGVGVPADPPTNEADEVKGFFALIFTMNYATDDVLLGLTSVGRLPQLGGGKLTDNVNVALTKSPGDFIGIEFNWWTSDDFLVTTTRPTLILKGYTFDASDFSDPTLRIAAAFDYTVVPDSEKTEYREEQEFLYNIAGVQETDDVDLKNFKVEGLMLNTRNLHGYAMTHFEILKAV